MSQDDPKSNAAIEIKLLEFRAIAGLAAELYQRAADHLRECHPDTPLWDAATNEAEVRLKILDSELKDLGHEGFDVSRRVDWPETI
jgi:hypothetical protein